MSNRQEQRGAALLTVLLLVGTLSVAAVIMTEAMNRATRHAISSEARGQTFWALLSIEDVALTLLERQASAPDASDQQLFAEPIVLATEFGVVTVRFEDASHCFNVNSLVVRRTESEDDDQDSSGEEQSSGEETERFALLVEAIGADRPTGRALAARITDFVDANNDPSPGGAEDLDYLRREVPYRTAGQDLISVSELRAIPGFSPSVYVTLAPFLCAYSQGTEIGMNINTLSLDKAPLLVAASRGALTLRQAEDAIRARPREGYQDVETFLSSGVLAGADLPQGMAKRLATRSTRLKMTATVETQGRRLVLEDLLSRDAGPVTVIERRMSGGL